MNADGVGRFEPARCPISVPQEPIERQSMICGYVNVPERHGDPLGPALRLAVAKFPRLSKAAKSEPVVLLAGGPGESNFEAFIPGIGSPGGMQLRASHDIVVIELRGLYYSRPSLVCTELLHVQELQLVKDPDGAEAIADDLSAIRTCHDRLVAEGVNLAAFNNLESAADIAWVMTALGYETFNLYGNSAGTMLAQHVMRAYPRRLRAVALGSVVPLAISSWPAMPANGTRALQRVFENYAADAACARAYPTVETDFISLIDSLNHRPRKVRLKDPVTGAPLDLLLTGNRIAQWIYTLLLTDATAGPSVPFAIARLAAGDYRPLQLGIGTFLPARRFSQGLQYSVACAEKGSYPPEAIDRDGPYPAFAKAVAGLPYGPERLLAACGIWDVPYLGDSINVPVTSAVPTLLLAGDFDPGIPPRYAHTVARTLSTAYVYTFPGVAHSPVDGGACPWSMVLAFLDDPMMPPSSLCMSNMHVRFVSEPIAERLLSPAPFHLIVLLICLTIMVLVPIGWVFGAWRRCSTNGGSAQVRLVKWCAAIASGLNLVFALIVLSANPAELVYGYPLVVRVAMILPLVSLLPIAGTVLSTYVLRDSRGRIWVLSLQNTIFSLALIIWIWELGYWHLLGWRL